MRYRGNEWRREDLQAAQMPEPLMNAYHQVFDAEADEERAAIRQAILKGIQDFGMFLPPPEEMYDIADVEDKVVVDPKTGQETEIVIVGPKGYKERGEKLPVLYFIHGGGLCLFNHRHELKNCMSLAHKLNAIVISPNYPLTPEYSYKETMNSLDSVVDWFVENAEDLYIDIEKVVVRGISTGAHLAAATSHKRKVKNVENNDPDGFQFAAQVLQWPILDDRLSYKSSDIDGGSWDPVLSYKSAKAWLGKDFGTPNVPEWAYPLRATDYRGLPPTFIHVAEHDHDRDSCIQYAQKLLDEGIFTELIVWGGAAHAGGGAHEPGVGERVRSTARAQIIEGLTGKLVRKKLREDNNFRNY